VAESNPTALSIIPLVVSILALLRPNLEALYRRTFKKPKVAIVCLDMLETGFNQFGPFVNSHMTFISSNKDVVILKVICEVTHLDSKETFKHDFFGFPSNEYPQGPFQLAKAIVINSGASFSSQIQFSSWEKISKIGKILKEFNGTLYLNGPFADDLELVNAIDDQLKSEKYKSVEDLDKLRFWKAGRYQVQFTVQTTESCDCNNPIYEFELSDAHEELFKLNKFQILNIYLGLGGYAFGETIPMRIKDYVLSK
jgi:hypothetical protein